MTRNTGRTEFRSQKPGARTRARLILSSGFLPVFDLRHRVFVVNNDSGLGHGIFAVGVRFQRRRGVHGEVFDAGSIDVFVIQHLLERDFLARVGGHTAH